MASSTSHPNEEWMSDYERTASKVNTRCLFHNVLPLVKSGRIRCPGDEAVDVSESALVGLRPALGGGHVWVESLDQ